MPGRVDGNWSAGINHQNNTACIGIIPTRVTSSSVTFHLGSFYTGLYPKFTLTDGDPVQLIVNGAPLDVHVKYGATVTN